MELNEDLYSLINEIYSCINQTNGSMFPNCRVDSTDNIVLQIEKLNDLLSQTKVAELCDPDSPTNNSSGQHKFLCESSHLHIILLGYFYPILVFMCLMGNFANIVIYNRKILRKSATVELLMIKAVMNMIFMTCLLPKHLVWFMSTGSIAFVNFEKILWSSWPYFLYVANVAGSSSTWMTVLMTLERYLCVAWPTSSKSVFSHPNVKKATYAVVVVFSVIHAQTPISRMTEMSVCEATGQRIYKLLMRPDYLYSVTEKIYSLLNLLLSLVVPGILLVGFTSRLTFILCCRSLPQFSARKRCVTRIALATMISQLTLEVPAVGVYGAAALRGVEFVNEDPTMCTCHILSNFANQMNASICFLIYLSCSETFRHLFYSRFCSSASIIGSGQGIGGGHYNDQRRSYNSWSMVARHPVVDDNFNSKKNDKNSKEEHNPFLTPNYHGFENKKNVKNDVMMKQ